MDEPTVTIACPVPRCARTVGPYYTEASAHRALIEHVAWRHDNFRMAGPVEYVDAERKASWRARFTAS